MRLEAADDEADDHELIKQASLMDFVTLCLLTLICGLFAGAAGVTFKIPNLVSGVKNDAGLKP